MNITPEDNHEPVFNAAQHTLSDVSHVLPVGLDIGLVYQDLVVNFTDLDAASTPALSTGMDGRITLQNSYKDTNFLKDCVIPMSLYRKHEFHTTS